MTPEQSALLGALTRKCETLVIRLRSGVFNFKQFCSLLEYPLRDIDALLECVNFTQYWELFEEINALSLDNPGYNIDVELVQRNIDEMMLSLRGSGPQ